MTSVKLNSFISTNVPHSTKTSLLYCVLLRESASCW